MGCRPGTRTHDLAGLLYFRGEIMGARGVSGIGGLVAVSFRQSIELINNRFLT